MDRLSQDLSDLALSAGLSIKSWLSQIPGSAILFRYIASSYQNDPIRSLLELFLLLFAIRYFLASKYSFSKRNYVRLNEKEINELVNEWQPEPLVEPLKDDEMWEINSIPIIDGSSGPTVKLVDSDTELINLSSTDVYDISNNPEIRQNAVKTIRKYGVGSCGPAGFYGNQDVHIHCEAQLAEFLETEGAIIYSQGFATASSVIPCFLKRGDVIIADKNVNVGIQKGILLSRATIYWYEHNNLQELESLMIKANKNHKRGPLPRRFIITESIFENSGDTCDLINIIKLKYQYKYRLLLDESWSIGIQGKTGRGLLEELGINRSKDIDISVGALANAFGSAGGFCAGRSSMIEHQRITSLAYTFSATMPAYLASTTAMVVDMMLKNENFRINSMDKLKKFGKLAHKLLGNHSKYIEILSQPDYPIIVLSISTEFANQYPDKFITDKDLIENETKSKFEELILQDIVNICKSQGVLISRQKR